MRLFLAQYPAVSLLLTSRIAGFRVIGASLSNECQHYQLAPFSASDITTLITAWYRVVVGSRKDVIDSALKLSETINTNARLLKLAENPLLLTTLL